MKLTEDALSQFTERVAGHGLSDFRDELLALAKPQLSLSFAEPVTEHEMGISRIGGPPDVGEDSDWKRDDQYWVFYFQLNLADIRQPDRFGLPESGLLSVYSDSQILADEVRLVHNQDIASLRSSDRPDLSHYLDADLGPENTPVCQQSPFRMSVRDAVALPTYALDSIHDSDSLDDAYFELRESYAGDIGILSPSYDSYSLDEPQGYQCLFNLYTGKYFQFGDCGNQAILVRSIDGKLDLSQTISEYNE